MSSYCNFKWNAPYPLAPPSKKIVMVEQICSLPKGHEGNHLSLSGVIAPLLRTEKPAWPDDFRGFATNVQPKKQR